MAIYATRSTRIGFDDAGVYRKPLATDQPFAHATAQDRLEHMTERIAVADSTMAVLGEGRMVRNLILQAETTELEIREVQMHFLAQSPLGSNAEAVADDQHPHHQLGIDRRAAGVAIERSEVFAQLVEVEESIDGAQQMVGWNVIVEVEGVKQSLLTAHLRTLHPDVLH